VSQLLDAVTSSSELESTPEGWLYFPNIADRFHKQINARHGNSWHVDHFQATNNTNNYLTSEVLIAMKISVAVMWVVTLKSYK
jgi:hypothetical protein